MWHADDPPMKQKHESYTWGKHDDGRLGLDAIEDQVLSFSCRVLRMLGIKVRVRVRARVRMRIRVRVRVR